MYQNPYCVGSMCRLICYVFELFFWQPSLKHNVASVHAVQIQTPTFSLVAKVNLRPTIAEINFTIVVTAKVYVVIAAEIDFPAVIIAEIDGITAMLRRLIVLREVEDRIFYLDRFLSIRPLVNCCVAVLYQKPENKNVCL